MRLRRARHGTSHTFRRQRTRVQSGTSRNLRDLTSSPSASEAAVPPEQTSTRGAPINENDTLLSVLCQEEAWQGFFAYKESLARPKAFARELRAFIQDRAYLPVCDEMLGGAPFPLPRKAEIGKMSSEKVRVVYTYPEPHNTVLKLLTYLLLRRYDHLFSDGLYSFRPNRSAKDAVRALIRTPGINGMHAYKVDVANYFNSIRVDVFLPMLREATGDDPQLFSFLSRLLEEPRVLDRGQVVIEDKGIMAGTPLSAFYANLCLSDLDRHFCELGVPYARYSDDIIVFAPSKEEVLAHAAFIRAHLEGLGLAVNHDKEVLYAPEDGWTFLGFSYRQGVVDIAPQTFAKLKAKMRRKSRALHRWQRRSGAEPERAARAFIRVFNHKLLESPGADNELSWKSWFFPVINTTETLHTIDLYAQDCIRFLASGTRTKARYRVRYEELKRLGYRNLVHAYYESADEPRSGDV